MDEFAINETLQNMLTNFIEFLPSIISALVIFLLGFVAAGLAVRALKRMLSRRGVGQELTQALSMLVRWTVIGLFTATALNQVNFDLTAFLTGLGILGFTVGFALQDVSKNFFAGLLLLLQQPFEIGDKIGIDSYTGTVTEINLRETEIKSVDGIYILIPNTQMFTNALLNYSRAEERRIALKVGVAYGTNPDFVKETAREALSDIPGLKPEPAPEISFDNFGGSTLDATIHYWIETAQTGVRPATDAGITRINTAFEEAGIDMPYPTQSLLLPEITVKTTNGGQAVPGGS